MNAFRKMLMISRGRLRLTCQFCRFAVTLAVLGLFSGLGSRAADAASDEFTEELVLDLTVSGFQVIQGYPKLYRFEDCVDYTYPALKNCFLANPAAPYVVTVGSFKEMQELAHRSSK